MATHDYDIANQSGANFRADLNNCLDAIVSNNSSSSEPSTKFAYMLWVDTSNNLIKLRNSANNAWITLPLSTTADNTVDINGGAIDGTAIGANSASTGAFTTISASSLITANGNLSLLGTTPTLTIGDGGAEDTKIVFDGNAQDFYIGLDDSADDLVIGRGSTVGTTPNIEINSANEIHFSSGDSDVKFYFGSAGGAFGGNSSHNIRASSNNFMFNSVADYIYEVGGSEKLRFTAAGNVGIGSTSPLRALHVSSSDNQLARFESTDAFGGIEICDNTSGTAKPLISALGNAFIFYNGGSSHSEAMRIDSSGNVGIGTTSVSKLLHIKSDDPVIRLEDSSPSAYAEIDGAGGDLIINCDAGNDDANSVMQFKVDNSERMRINSSGRLLGFTTVSKDPGDTPDDSNSYNIGPGFMFLNRDDTASVDQITFGKNGSVAGRITTTSSTTYTTTSDYRKKENVTPVVNGLERVQKLNPVSYTWIDVKDKVVEEGFIAHEVQEAGWETGVSGEKDGEDVQSMDYGRITPLLVKAIQEQQELIEDLQTQINKL